MGTRGGCSSGVSAAEDVGGGAKTKLGCFAAGQSAATQHQLVATAAAVCDEAPPRRHAAAGPNPLLHSGGWGPSTPSATEIVLRTLLLTVAQATNNNKTSEEEEAVDKQSSLPTTTTQQMNRLLSSVEQPLRGMEGRREREMRGMTKKSSLLSSFCITRSARAARKRCAFFCQSVCCAKPSEPRLRCSARHCFR